MDRAMCLAIAERRVLAFEYEGFEREVQPHAHGTSTAGNEVISAY